MAAVPEQPDGAQHLSQLLTQALTEVSRVLAAQQETIVDLQGRIARLEHPLPAPASLEQQWKTTPYCAIAGNLRMVDESGRTLMGYRRPKSEAIAEASHAYVSFEDVFRGPPARVRELLRPYISMLQGRSKVLELGCGRGELLELLAEGGIDAVGVDADTGMLERSRQIRFNGPGDISLVQQDMAQYLSEQPDASCDGIISIQVAEHLDPATIPALLNHARRVLEPGGVLVMETVNPHNLIAHKLFWIDPTHRHPLFPETMVVLAASAGFDTTSIMFPDSSGSVEADLATCDRYTLIATVDKPQTSCQL